MRTRNVTRRQSDLMVGLQLTHSGRFARPNRKDLLEPRIAYHHPILDRKFGIAPDDDRVVLTDGEVEELIGDFVRAASIAEDVGFDFVDIKHCHGYLLHEFLGDHPRPGRYGGDFEGRTRLLKETVAAVKQGLSLSLDRSQAECLRSRPVSSRSCGIIVGTPRTGNPGRVCRPPAIHHTVSG